MVIQCLNLFLIVLWSVFGDCENLATMKGHSGAIMDLHFSTDGRFGNEFYFVIYLKCPYEDKFLYRELNRIKIWIFQMTCTLQKVQINECVVTVWSCTYIFYCSILSYYYIILQNRLVYTCLTRVTFNGLLELWSWMEFALMDVHWKQ